MLVPDPNVRADCVKDPGHGKEAPDEPGEAHLSDERHACLPLRLQSDPAWIERSSRGALLREPGRQGPAGVDDQESPPLSHDCCVAATVDES